MHVWHKFDRTLLGSFRIQFAGLSSLHTLIPSVSFLPLREPKAIEIYGTQANTLQRPKVARNGNALLDEKLFREYVISRRPKIFC
jgi:hypothetical protein